MSERSQLAAVEFAENPEPRCPCVLLLDTSGSMEGKRIEALNEGLATFQNVLMRDTLASKRVEIAIVTFNNEVSLVQDFVTVDKFDPPELVAFGQTHMGEGIQRALDLVDARKKTYKDNAISYYRPWVFMITDGTPEGEPQEIVAEAAQRVHDGESRKKVAFFAVGVEGADMKRLAEIADSKREPIKLKGLKFEEMFVWLSASMQEVSRSETDDPQVPLAPVGWGYVSQ